MVRVDTAGEEEAVREALKAIPLGMRFAITRPGGGGEYAEEPTERVAGQSTDLQLRDSRITFPQVGASTNYATAQSACGRRAARAGS